LREDLHADGGSAGGWTGYATPSQIGWPFAEPEGQGGRLSVPIELHIKEYRNNPDGKPGVWTNLRENGINWPEGRKALDEVRFDGFARRRARETMCTA
jgi:hypothetical protein